MRRCLWISSLDVSWACKWLLFHRFERCFGVLFASYVPLLSLSLFLPLSSSSSPSSSSSSSSSSWSRGRDWPRCTWLRTWLHTGLQPVHTITPKTLKSPTAPKTLKTHKTLKTLEAHKNTPKNLKHLKHLCVCAPLSVNFIFPFGMQMIVVSQFWDVFWCVVRVVCASLSLSLPLFLGHRHRDHRHRHRHRHGLVVEINHNVHDCVHDYTMDYSQCTWLHLKHLKPQQYQKHLKRIKHWKHLKHLKLKKTLKTFKTHKTLKTLVCLCAAVCEFHPFVGHANDCCFAVLSGVLVCCSRRMCLSLSASFLVIGIVTVVIVIVIVMVSW